MARQFNLIPPICEQPEYNLFQREKIEALLPDVIQKIGLRKKTTTSTTNFSICFVRHWHHDMVAISMRYSQWKIRGWSTIAFKSNTQSSNCDNILSINLT